MDAKETRELAELNFEKMAVKDSLEIYNRIEKAATEGLFSIRSYDKLTTAVISKLENEGYTVRIQHDRDGSNIYFISW